ncbi:hypothetical protein OAT18_01545 [Tenacibaculum sp.]|nr:hypothetical protein [Tenacibaculum sp.]
MIRRFLTLFITILFPLLLQAQECWLRQGILDLADVKVSSEFKTSFKSGAYEEAYKFLHEQAFDLRTDVSVLKKLSTDFKNVLSDLKNVNEDFLKSETIHLDLGGHNRYPEAVKIITADVDYSNKRIENLLDAYIQDFTPKFKDKSVDRITIESAPVSDDILKEVNRITKDEGSIELEHATVSNLPYNEIANKVGGTIANSEKIIKDGFEYTRVTIIKSINGITENITSYLKKYPKLKEKLDEIDSTAKIKFLEDFAKTSKKNIEVLGNNPSLVDSWGILRASHVKDIIRQDLVYIKGIFEFIKRAKGEGIVLDLIKIQNSILKKIDKRKYIESLYSNEIYGGLNLSDEVIENLTPIYHKKFDLQFTGDKRFDSFDINLNNGSIYYFDGVVKGKGKWRLLNNIGDDQFSFVITLDGKLKIGHGHYNLSNSASKILSAGSIKVTNGKISFISNGSGHYLPSIEDLEKVILAFKNLGIVSDELKIWKIKMAPKRILNWLSKNDEFRKKLELIKDQTLKNKFFKDFEKADDNLLKSLIDDDVLFLGWKNFRKKYPNKPFCVN